MPDYVCRGRVQLQQAADFIASQLSHDKVWRISVGPYREKRTLPQNDRFHKLIALMASETGEDPKRLKEWVKAEFGQMVSVEVGGRAHSVPAPSREYEVAQMSEVMERLEAFAARELGIALGG